MKNKPSGASRGSALITGASSGIGYELAKLFASDGHDVVLVARGADTLESIASQFRDRHGVQATAIAKDLAKPDAPQQIYDELRSRSTAIEVLVNNAGFAELGYFHERPLARELEMIQVNVAALTSLTRLFVADMVARGSGRILNVASTAAFQPGPMMAVYYATKAYVLSFSEALANELKDKGVSVTALCPGPTITGFAERAEGVAATRLFIIGTMDAPTVARAGYRALMRGKALVIPGLRNQLLALSVRLGPRSLPVKFVRYLHGRAGEHT